MGINISHWFVNYELEQMAKYLDLVVVALQDNQKNLMESFEAETKDMTEAEKSDFDQFHEDDYIEAGSDFPRLLFSSFVVTWYSFTENHLIDLCAKRGLRIMLSIRDSEHYGEGVRRACKFLNDAANYRIDSDHWQELLYIGRVRNKIVHEGGRLTYSYINSESKSVQIKLSDDEFAFLHVDSDLYRYLQKHNLIEFTGLYYVTPSYDYCKHLVSFGKELFTKIYEDLGHRT